MGFVPGVLAPATVERRVWFVVHGDGIVVREVDGRAALLRDGELADAGATPAAIDYLGELDGAHAFAAILAAPPPPPFVARSLRSLYGAIDDHAWAVAGRATQLVQWAATHRYCGRCAAPTRRLPAERAMRCDACELVSYPRISPAIIVLVRRGDEALLARGAHPPRPWYSTLAGFCEAGESLEETLVREVREEVGIDVGNLRYFGSQSWPFPHSLMVGFTAEHTGGELCANPDEIAAAEWFTIDRLPPIPPAISIARALIDAWVAEVRGRS
jgi:NAD+ diphosphatase